MPTLSDRQTQPAVTALPGTRPSPQAATRTGARRLKAALGARSPQIIPIRVISAGSDETGETAPNGGDAQPCCRKNVIWASQSSAERGQPWLKTIGWPRTPFLVEDLYAVRSGGLRGFGLCPQSFRPKRSNCDRL